MWGRWVQIQYTLKSNTDAFWLHTVLEISDASNTSTSRKDKEINDGSWKCLSHQLLVCCLLTFIAITTITITSAHFDPLQVHRNRLLRSPCNNRIFTKIERIWGWSVFLLDPRTSCNRWNDSNEPTQKEKCQTLPNAVRNSNFASLRGIPVPQKLSMVCGMPCLIFSFSLPPGFIKFLRATSFSKYSSTHSSPTTY